MTLPTDTVDDDTQVPSSTHDPDRRATSAGRGRGVPIVLAVLGVLMGALLGRGLFLDTPTDPSTAAPAVAATDLAERIAQLEQRTSAAPDDSGAWQELGVAYVQRAEATGDPAFHQLAGRALERAAQLAPDDPATVTAQGVLALALHDFARALDLGEQVVADNDRNVTALGVVVDAQVELGRYEQAAATAQQMLDVRPSLPALSRASYLRELSGDVDGAVLAMEQAATAGQGLTFDLARIEALLGDVHAHHGDHDRAAAAYDRALALDDDLPRALTGRARLAAIDGDLDAAVEQLEAVTATVPYPGALLLLAELQAFAGDEQAASDTEEVVRATVQLQQAADQSVDLELAFFEADAGDGATAVALAEQAYAARPNLYAAAAVAWAQHVAGDAPTALPFVDEALAQGTRDALLRYRMAAVLAGAGATDRAAAELATAFEIDPWFSWRHRADAQRLADELNVPTPPAWAER